MPLNLSAPIKIKTGFKVELEKTGSTVKILSLTFRFSERAVLVEYAIIADDGSGRDHRNALIIPIDSLKKSVLNTLLSDCYGEMKKHPSLGNGTVTPDSV